MKGAASHMRLRLCALGSPVAVLLGLLMATPAPVAGQAANAVAKAAKAPTLPRLPDGRPDLQGYWTNTTFTPLERSPELGEKEFFTEAEAEAYEKQRRLRENSQSEGRPPLRQCDLARGEPREGCLEPAHVDDFRSAGRASSAVDGERSEARGRTARSGAAQRGRRKRREPQPGGTLHHLGSRRPAHAGFDL